MQSAAQLLSSIPWFAWIAIVVILSGSISGAFCSWLKHRERIEMIRQGMNPDASESSKTELSEL
ncbi:hypothetical protein [Tautonia sociabilis]|uniref:Uncharacterized protein n=1 Tax=Tautonia sociabilis TaxID=2080755 RepID=A0A432MGN6_9BACT|nr:hypothetical protein [Tautonia sociabilis]RUL85956.1 hypothetical protein TsocGM_17470 [Tautonia sociabilis]